MIMRNRPRGGIANILHTAIETLILAAVAPVKQIKNEKERCLLVDGGAAKDTGASVGTTRG